MVKYNILYQKSFKLTYWPIPKDTIQGSHDLAAILAMCTCEGQQYESCNLGYNMVQFLLWDIESVINMSCFLIIGVIIKNNSPNVEGNIRKYSLQSSSEDISSSHRRAFMAELQPFLQPHHPYSLLPLPFPGFIIHRNQAMITGKCAASDMQPQPQAHFN